MRWGARERRKAEGPVAGAGDGFSALGRSSVKERWTMAQRPRAHHPLLRREALLALGGGIGAIWYASRRVRAIRSAFAVSTASAAVPCVLTPEQTEGPYYIASEPFRSDVTEDRLGLPLLLHLRVLDPTTCNRIEG